MRTIHPRPDFLASNVAQPFGDLLANPALAVGIRAALLEFQIAEPRAATWEQAAQSHHYLQGARDFANYLLTFLDSEPIKPQPANENLKWPTKQSLQPRPQARKA